MDGAKISRDITGQVKELLKKSVHHFRLYIYLDLSALMVTDVRAVKVHSNVADFRVVCKMFSVFIAVCILQKL